MGADAGKREPGEQEVKAAQALSGASEPWPELVRAGDSIPWLGSLEFRVKIQC